MVSNFSTMRASRRLILLASVAGAVFGGAQRAAAFGTNVGDWQVNIDTTLSSSVDIRTSNVDQRFVGTANGGTFFLPNEDNGTLNFKPGTPVAATQRITTEIQIKRDDYGLFLRATGFYDPVIDSERTDFQQLSNSGRQDIGASARLLDAYVFAHPMIGDHGFDVRIGNQALNWGESTFIQFGINSINPLDVTALRTPGSELRNAFLPIPVVDVRTDIVPDLSVEAFWQPVWVRSRLEPTGSFFSAGSSVDELYDGGTRSLLFAGYPDTQASVNAVKGAGNALGAALPRSLDRHPNGLGEFGIAIRKNVPEWGDSEFGLYFENYDSRTPFGSIITGSKGSVLPSLFTALGIGHAASYTSTTSFFADYPKDIHLVGFSWNFTAPAGVAVQGEISTRLNQPLQLGAADQALLVNSPAACYLFKALGGLAAAAGVACGQAHADPTITLLGGVPGFHQIVAGWKRYPVTQIQTTATKLFSSQPALHINSIALVGEIGLDYVHGFAHDRGVYSTSFSTDTNSAFERAATYSAGTYAGPTQLSRKGLATQTSAAYTIAVIIDMPDLLPYGIDMKPTFSLQHDFMGTSPVGANIFQENTAAASAGVTFNYLQAWSLGMQYTNHFPIFDGGKFYGALDRDFFSTTLSYEF